MVSTYRSGSANEMPLVAASLLAAATALPGTCTRTMSPRLSAWLPIRCRAAAFSAWAVLDDRPLNRGWIEVAPSRDSAVFTTAFDVFGASAVLPRRSGFPVTDVPDRTTITVPGTAPVRCVGLTSLESAVLFRTDGPA